MTLDDAARQEVYDLYIKRNLLNKEAGFTKFHVDHIVPLVLGGAHEGYNLRILEASDNLSKGKKLRPEDWEVYSQRVAAMFTEAS